MAVKLEDVTAEWSSRITKVFYQTRNNFFEMGRLLLDAKNTLPHGEFIVMIKEKLPFGARQAQRLMKIAENKFLANTTYMSHLPASMGTLYDLACLNDETLSEMRRADLIRPDMQRNDIARAKLELSVQADKHRVSKLGPVRGRFRTLVLDPPWESGGGRGVPYATMSQSELEDSELLPVRKWLTEDKAHLYCWTTAGEMRNALRLLELWEVEFQCILTWVKPSITLGSYFRHQAEFVLFATRGKLLTRDAARKISTVFEAPKTPVHSEKPDKFYEIVRAASYEPFGEAFQRKPRDGFTGLYEPRNSVERVRIRARQSNSTIKSQNEILQCHASSGS